MRLLKQVDQPLGKDYCIISLTKNKVAIVDVEDYEKLSKVNWFANVKPHGTYALRIAPRNREKIRHTIQMHRVIMCAPLKVKVDHRNHDTLDNRKSNLRLVTNSQNSMNSRIRSDNKSGYKGVFWSTQAGRWQVRIQFNKKVKHIGFFDDPKVAHSAYCEAALSLHGEHACFG